MNKPLRAKRAFAPTPPRALADPRMTLVDLKVLGCVAYQDRFSLDTGGQGCWASYKTIAREIGHNETNVSTALSRLSIYGYIVHEPRAADKRKRTYRVVYNESDKAFGVAEIVCPGANETPSEPEIVCPAAKDPTEIVCPAIPETPNLQAHDSRNVFREADEYTLRRSALPTIHRRPTGSQ